MAFVAVLDSLTGIMAKTAIDAVNTENVKT